MRATVTALPRGESSGTGESSATRGAAMGEPRLPQKPGLDVAALGEVLGDQHGPARRAHLGVVRDEHQLDPVLQDGLLPDPSHAGGHAPVRVAVEAGLAPVKVCRWSRSTASNERAKPSHPFRQVCTWAKVKLGRPALSIEAGKS